MLGRGHSGDKGFKPRAWLGSLRQIKEGGLSGWSEGSEGEETGGKARGAKLTLTSLGAVGRKEPSSFYKIFTSLIDFMGFTAPCPVGP